MSEIYEEAKQKAHELVKAEILRKEHADKVKTLKEELMEILENNSIDTFFEFQDGIVELVEKENFVIPDGMKEEVEVKVNKIEPDIINAYFKGDIKLNNSGKKALAQSMSPELSSLVDIEIKKSIKVTLG